jgi:hypothetical protein
MQDFLNVVWPIGPWPLALPTGSALLALVLGFSVKERV